MTRLFSWLTGMRSLPSGKPESVKLEFLYLPQGHALAVFAAAFLIAAGLAFWVYHKRRENLGRRRWAMTGLRIAAFMLLMFVLGGPVIEITGASSSRSTVALLFDNSASMSLVDAKGSDQMIRNIGAALGHRKLAKKGSKLTPELEKEITEASRAQIMKRVAGSERKGLIDMFASDYDLRFYTFGKHVQAANPKFGRYEEWIGGLPTRESQTRLGSAIQNVLTDMRGTPLAGMIVLSDGSANAGSDAAEACELAGRRGIPTYFIGIGDPGVKDVQVSFIDMRDVVFVDDKVPVNVKIKNHGCGGRVIQLVLRAERREMARKEVVLDELGDQIETIRFTPDKKGTHTFTVRAEPIQNELVVANNEKSKQARVVDQKIKVLWVETAPRWEYRYAKNLIQRDKKRFDGRALLFEVDPELIAEDDTGFFLKKFPYKKEDLMQYHVVILGDIVSGRLTAEQMEWLKLFVNEKGGALIFLPGRMAGPGIWRDTVLEELLPVIPAGSQELRDPLDDINRPVAQGLRAKLTPGGSEHPLMYVHDDDKESKKAWHKYLRIYTNYKIERVKPGVQVMLESRDEEKTPLIVNSMHGSGSVLYVGTDDLWRWRYRPGPITHDRFWGSLLQQMSLANLLGESRALSLTLSREELAVGDDLRIRVQLLAAGDEAMNAETMEVTLVSKSDDDKSNREEVVLRREGKGTGTFSGAYSPTRTGSYTVTAAHDEEQISRGFRAIDPQAEFENPSLNREDLLAWAKLSGGNVFDPWDLDSLPDEVVAKAKSTHMRIVDELWDAPLWLILFVMFAGIEWFWRKWENLP